MSVKKEAGMTNNCSGLIVPTTNLEILDSTTLNGVNIEALKFWAYGIVFSLHDFYLKLLIASFNTR